MRRITMQSILPIILLAVLWGCGKAGWQSVETDQLILHYRAGSYAERNLEQAVAVYEDSLQAARRLLPQVRLKGKVKVYLHDHLDKLGFTLADRREVHFRYDEEFRLTSMHEFLHIFLHRLNPKAPLRFEEGVCRMHEARTVRDGNRRVQVPLVQLGKRAAPETWRLTEIFQDFYDTDDQGNLAAAFAAFAMQEHGEERFWTFYGDLRKDVWQKPLEVYFGQDAPTIESRFVAYMERIPNPPGMQ